MASIVAKMHGRNKRIPGFARFHRDFHDLFDVHLRPHAFLDKTTLGVAYPTGTPILAPEIFMVVAGIERKTGALRCEQVGGCLTLPLESVSHSRSHDVACLGRAHPAARPQRAPGAGWTPTVRGEQCFASTACCCGT